MQETVFQNKDDYLKHFRFRHPRYKHQREQKEVSNTNVTIVHGCIYRFVDVKAAPHGNAVNKYKLGET